ncbi:hypothetical protein PMAYCL1PPCAC_06075, partial [Pristionchus mayeri]
FALLVSLSVSLTLMDPDELPKLFQYSTPYEMTDRVVEDLCREYPELRPANDQDMIVLKREVVYLFEIPRSEQMELIAGFPSKFKQLPTAIKKLKKIGKKEIADLDEEDKNLLNDEEEQMFIQMVYKPVVKYLMKKKEIFEKSGLTMDKFKEINEKTQTALIFKWHKDDPGAMLPSRSDFVPNEDL